MALHKKATRLEGQGGDTAGGLTQGQRSLRVRRGWIPGSVVFQPQGNPVARPIGGGQDQIQPAVAAPLGDHKGRAQSRKRLQENEPLAIAPQKHKRTPVPAAAPLPEHSHEGFRLPVAIEIDTVEHIARSALLLAGSAGRPRGEQNSLQRLLQNGIREGDRGDGTLDLEEGDRRERRELHQRIAAAPTVRCEG